MQKKLNYQVANQRTAANWNFRDIDLSIARVNVEIPLAGDFLQVPTAVFSDDTTVDTSSSVGTCFVRFDERDGKPYYLSTGATVRMTGSPFGTLYITNEAQAGAKMRIYTSALADSDPQAVTNFASDIATSYTAEISDNAVSTTAVVIVPARAARKAGLIQNNDASTDLKITVSGGTTGVIVPAGGGQYSYNHTAAVYGVTAAGTIAAADIISNEEYS